MKIGRERSPSLLRRLAHRLSYLGPCKREDFAPLPRRYDLLPRPFPGRPGLIKVYENESPPAWWEI